jgi:hypothetical protein
MTLPPVMNLGAHRVTSSPPGDNFTLKDQSSLLGSHFAPGGKIKKNGLSFLILALAANFFIRGVKLAPRQG